MEHIPADSPCAMLSEAITDSRVRELYLDCIANVSGLHEEVTHAVTGLEVRFFFRDALLARIVPYRELLHIQVGNASGWEIRVREEQGYLETLDLIIHQFLHIFSNRPVPSH